MAIDNYNPATWDDEKPVLPEDFNKWEQTLKALTEELNRHMSVPNDHKLTKNDLGLGSVFNYGLATDAEASAGTSKVKYMSPYLVSLTITALQSIKSVNGRTGIIQLSKTDVGLGNVKDYDTATNAQALDGSLATLYMTPLTTKAAIEKFAQTIANQAEANAKNYALPLIGGEMSGQIASTAQTPIQARLASGVYSWARGKQVAGTKVKVELRENSIYTRSLEIIVGSGLGASSESGDFTINAWGTNETTLTGMAPMTADNVRYYINDQMLTIGYMQMSWWHRVTRNADNTKNYVQFSAPLDFSGIGGISGPGVNFLQSYLRLNGKDVALNEDLKTHTDDAVRHITASERLDWNGKETPAAAQVKANQAETNAKNYALANTGGTMKGAINSEAVIAMAGKVGEIKHYVAPQPDGTKIRFDIFENGVWSRGLDIVVGEGNIVGDADFFIMPLTSTSSYIVGFGPITSQKSRATIVETGGTTLAGSAFTVVWWFRVLRNFYDTCIQAYKNLTFSGYGNSQLEKTEFKTKSLTKNGKEIAIVDDISTAVTNVKLPERNIELLSAGFEKIRKGSTAKILCYGDSLTYGYDIYSADKRAVDPTPTSNGTKHTRERASTTYPEALESALKQVYPLINVQNWGYSGDTVLSSYAKWDGINPNADVTLFMLGHNDSKNATESISDFINGYRKIIDRALNWNSGIIFLTPPKQQNGADFTVDTYSQAVIQLAKEYHAPVIDMSELTAGISADHYSDSVHFNGKGYDYIGKKLASIFINKSILNMNKVKAHDSLTVTRENSGIQFNESCSYSTSEYFPTEDSVEVGKGNALVLKTGGKVYFSFYVGEDNLLFLPSIYAGSKTLNLKMEVNFSAEPANTAITYAFNTTNARAMNKPLKTATFTTADLNWYSASALYIDGRINASKLLYAPRKGYYTVSIENLDTYAVNLFNLEFRNTKTALFENNFLYTLGTFTGDILTLQPGNYELYNSSAVNMPFATGLASIEVYGGGSGRKILKVKNLTSNITWEGNYNPATSSQITWNQIVTDAQLVWTKATLKNGYSHFASANVYFAMSSDGKQLLCRGTGSVSNATTDPTVAFTLPSSFKLDFSASVSCPVQGNSSTARVLIDANTNDVTINLGNAASLGVLLSFSAPVKL